MTEPTDQNSCKAQMGELNRLIDGVHSAYQALERLVPTFAQSEEPGSRSRPNVGETPGLWEVMPPGCACLDDLGGGPRNCAIIAPGSPSFTSHHVACRVSAEDAARIVACVNACQGVPTEKISNLSLTFH